MSSLLTYPPLHFIVCRLRSALSPGLAISALVCLDFSFRLPPSAISFSWRHLYLTSAHVHTISTSSLCGIPPSGTCVPLSRCLHFSHDLAESFLLPTATCAFQLCAISSSCLFTSFLARPLPSNNEPRYFKHFHCLHFLFLNVDSLVFFWAWHVFPLLTLSPWDSNVSLHLSSCLVYLNANHSIVINAQFQSS